MGFEFTRDRGFGVDAGFTGDPGPEVDFGLTLDGRFPADFGVTVYFGRAIEFGRSKDGIGTIIDAADDNGAPLARRAVASSFPAVRVTRGDPAIERAGVAHVRESFDRPGVQTSCAPLVAAGWGIAASGG